MTGRVWTIRPEGPADEAGVREVEELAFGRPVEARLAEALRRACPACLSLVAVGDTGRNVGHIVFSPVTLEPDGSAGGGGQTSSAAGGDAVASGACGMGLGPLAVLPERQRQGIGSALVERGLEELRAAGCPCVFLVGHPGYYPRFGFVRASGLGLRSQWDAVPDEAWLALVFDPAALPAAGGLVRFRSEFAAAG